MTSDVSAVDVGAGEVDVEVTEILHTDKSASASNIAEPLDDAPFELVACPTCGQNMQQFPRKKQIDHYRRCVVSAFNQTSQEMAPFLASTSQSVHSPVPPPSFSSVGEWLQHLDLQQYQRLFLSAGQTMHSIHSLTEAQLVALGVPTVGARRRMLNSIDLLKRHLPAAAEELPPQPKKRNKSSAPKPAPTTAASAPSAAPSGSNAAPSSALHHVESLPQLRSIARITEKAAVQSAAAMQAATLPSAPAPCVPFLADSSIADSVPLFPGSIMRRVHPAALFLLFRM